MPKKPKPKRRPRKDSKGNYLDNKIFYQKLKEHDLLCKKAEENNQPLPPISDDIGDIITSLAKHISNMPCFNKYTYKEDMISDAAENCTRKIRKFDLNDPGQNPFSYFTTVIINAFWRRAKKEKRATISTFVAFESYFSGDNEVFSKTTYHEDGFFNDEIFKTSPLKVKPDTSLADTRKYINEKITDYEDTVEKKNQELRDKKKLTTLDDIDFDDLLK